MCWLLLNSEELEHQGYKQIPNSCSKIKNKISGKNDTIENLKKYIEKV